jgi:hypothetical protein
MTMSASTSGPDLFNLLADEFAERYRRGERPPLSEYTDKYPELAAEIRELFPALVAIEQFGSRAEKGISPITVDAPCVPGYCAATRLDLESTFRPRGRPKKAAQDARR